MPTTIHDVARRLNLSITTISRALDGYDDVADATRQRVLQVAREMGYVPSRAARQLRRNRADALGYILPTHDPRFTDPFFAEFMAGLGDEAAAHNLDLLVSTAPPGEEAERQLYARWVHGRRVDGLVLSRMRRQDWRTEFLAARGLPFVCLGRADASADHVWIEADARAGFAALVAHLASLGHRRIAYVGAPADLALQADRHGGYCDGLAAAGLPIDPDLVTEGDLTRRGGQAAARRLLALPNPPSAILAANDLTAIGVMRAAQECGLVLGRDLAVAGYDGIEAGEHTQPALTTLSVPVYDMARRLAAMLVCLIAGERLDPSQVMLQPELVIRDSSGGPRSD